MLSYTETRSESPSRQSRFSELLGKKEKNEPKKQAVPKSLDDFMANISGKANTGSSAANKKGLAFHEINFASTATSCVASVSVRFRSKE